MAFGGAIKLTGESEYKKALQQITQNLKEVSSQMKVVTTEYGKNDTSINGLTAKQNVLNQRLTEQQNKLKVLQSQYSTMASKYAENTQKHEALVQSYNNEKTKLDQLKATVGTTSKEYQDQKAKVEELANEVKKSTANQQANATAMSNMRIQINNAQADINKTTNEIDELNKELAETPSSADKLGSSIEDAGKKAEGSSNGGFTVFKGMLANLGTQVITGVISGLQQLGAAFINVGKQAVQSFAQYEQLVGGVDTLFKQGSQTVQNYANEAYKTAGISANEYMSTVTSFSASLISSLGGDTEKASEYANRAIVDMSDNANKMGTSMEMIQNAYQGFAKQNYTMLDNLKLGYGGTKSEMQRLIQDASKMTEVQKELGITVDANDMSFGNIVNAISVMQKEMDIAGTTAKEASTTIEGSTNSMKAAWQNLLTGLASGGDIGPLIDNFVDSVMTLANNLIPVIKNVVSGMGNLVSGLLTELVPQLVKEIPPLLQEMLPLLINSINTAINSILEILPQVAQSVAEVIPLIVTNIISLLPTILNAGIQILLSLIKGIAQTIPQLLKMLPDIIVQLVTTILDALPQVLETGIEVLVALIEGITEAIPKLIEALPTVIEAIVNTIFKLLPQIIEAAIKIIEALVKGLIQAIPKIIAAVPQIIKSLVTTLISNLPKIVEQGKEIIVKLASGIGSFMGKVGEKAREIGTNLLNGIKNLPNQMAEVGKNLVKGIFNGISNMKDWLFDKIKGFKDAVLNKFKGLFGIHSPSKLFKEQIGENLALGIGEGFSDEMNTVVAEMQDAIPTNFDTNINTTGTAAAMNEANYSYDNLVSTFEKALSNMKVVLDDEVAGHFVVKTVTDAIYY